MIKALLVIAFLSLLSFATCSQGYIVNMNTATKFPEGRDLFLSKCGACHRLYDPNSLTAAAWDSVLVPMQEKAKIDNGQKNKIYKWILEVKETTADSLNKDIKNMN